MTFFHSLNLFQLIFFISKEALTGTKLRGRYKCTHTHLYQLHNRMIRQRKSSCLEHPFAYLYRSHQTKVKLLSRYDNRQYEKCINDQTAMLRRSLIITNITQTLNKLPYLSLYQLCNNASIKSSNQGEIFR